MDDVRSRDNHCAITLAQHLRCLMTMVHRIPCVALITMSLVATAAAQDLHDRALNGRAIKLETLFLAAAQRYGVDARVLRAICFVESGYRINALSAKGARGLMQFMPDTAARYGLRDPHDPEQSIDAAARYLRDLMRKFDGRVDLAVAAYNAGEGAVSSFMTGIPLILRDGTIVNAKRVRTGGIPPYRETQKYVRSVLALLNGDAPRSVETSKARLRFENRRNRTLDVFDVTEGTEKISRTRASNFIDVP